MFWDMSTNLPFSEDRQQKFLDALRETCNITVAAQAIGVSTTTISKYRKEDPLFEERFKEAMEEGVDLLEHEAHRRAFQGVEEPVFYKGDECGTVRKYSDGLTMFLLKAHRPTKYRDNAALELTGKNGGPVEITEQERASRLGRLFAMARLRKQGEDSGLV